MANTIFGIEKSQAEKTVTALNELLSSYQVFYQNLRGYHWNIIGKDFFELHLKFEEYYNDAQVKIDEIAERILTLEATPLHSFDKYLEHSKLEIHNNVFEGAKAVDQIREQLEVLIENQKTILHMADDSNDIATSDLMTQYISAQEKTVWMLRSFLS
jgi:starvation-inducible DNA-binding protein